MRPEESDGAYGFTGVGAELVHVPRSSDPGSVAALRAACSGADLVHAHGLHASFRTSLALGGRGTPFVVTWHDRAYAEGPRAHFLRVLERRVVRAATVVLGTTSALVDRARRSGARDARLAAVSLPGPRSAPASEETERRRPKVRAELGAVDRPLIVAVGSLERHRGHDVLVDAAHAWQRLDPAPLVVIAGRGRSTPNCGAPSRRGTCRCGCSAGREDASDLLAAADVAVLPCRSEDARSTFAQEALHARVPLVVASRVGSLPNSSATPRNSFHRATRGHSPTP